MAAVGLLAAVGCRLQLPAAPTEPWTTPVHPITYTGVVFEPHSRTTNSYHGNGDPIPGARVTIVGGQPDGWTTLTDAEGRYAFEDYPYCELKSAECGSRLFRVEKAGYETREVGASDPDYRYSPPRYSASDKRVAMGLEWPADSETQRMRRDLPAIHPLWLLERPALSDEGFAGTYVSGIIRVQSLENLGTLGHEYCHAHQDWSVDPARYTSYGGWVQTPSGHAYVAAWEADWPHPYLSWIEIHGSRARIKSPAEEAAEICSNYFYDFWHPLLGTVGRRYLREHVPHLHAWAEEWLRWR